MLLELVWQNPDPPARMASKVRRVQGDQDGAVLRGVESSLQGRVWGDPWQGRLIVEGETYSIPSPLLALK